MSAEEDRSSGAGVPPRDPTSGPADRESLADRDRSPEGDPTGALPGTDSWVRESALLARPAPRRRAARPEPPPGPTGPVPDSPVGRRPAVRPEGAAASARRGGRSRRRSGPPLADLPKESFGSGEVGRSTPEPDPIVLAIRAPVPVVPEVPEDPVARQIRAPVPAVPEAPEDPVARQIRAPVPVVPEVPEDPIAWQIRAPVPVVPESLIPGPVAPPVPGPVGFEVPEDPVGGPVPGPVEASRTGDPDARRRAGSETPGGGEVAGPAPIPTEGRPALDLEAWRARGARPAETWGIPAGRGDPTWTFEEVRGRLLELTARGASARDSLAFSLIVDAQTRGEPVAWIGRRGSCFFPPDAARVGADLEALVVVLLSREEDLGRAGELLIRSGAFGLLVLDLGTHPWSVPSQARMAGWAKQHGAAVLALTDKGAGQPSLGPLIGLRAEVRRVAEGSGSWRCQLEVAKDRLRQKGWRHEEIWHGPPGLC